MVDKVTDTLEMLEGLVRDGKIPSFSVSIGNKSLRVKADNSNEVRTIPLRDEIYDSLHTYFYGVENIAYRSHDYSSLKSFIHARIMLDKMLNQEEGL
ncbi:hypothetical protein [Pontibacter rugosus]